jgi:hypothetical protein
MSEPSVQPSKRQRGRSPAYPAIPLDLAIARTQVIYQRERRHSVAIPVIQTHWGLKSGSGTGNVAVAALKKFGLLIDEGQGTHRTARLTDLAVDILLSDDDAERHLRLVQRAALLPPIHKELWEKYEGTLPSDATLRRELVLVRNFTESGAQEFIAQFRKTLAFARLDGGSESSGGAVGGPARLVEDHEEREEGPVPMQSHVVAPAQPVPQSSAPSWMPPGPGAPTSSAASPPIPIYLPGGPPVYLTGQFPISEAAWKQLMTVLEAMKGGLVAE